MRHAPSATIAAIAAAILLAGCGGDADPTPSNATAPVVKPKPLSVVDPQAYKADPSTAMREVPEGMRQDVQRAIVCHVDRQRTEGGVKPLDAETIRVITESIKAGTTVEDACKL
jgi:hypothetical protein